MELKIGILLPRSDMFPTLGRDFLNGLKLSLKNSTANVIPSFLVEGIGNAADESLLKTTEKMLLQEDIDLAVSFCSIYRLEEMVSLFHNYKKPLIHIDLGGSVLKKEHTTSPYVIHHTLNIWQTAYATGRYVAQKIGKTAAVITSIYEGGYHIGATFEKGFLSEGGYIASYYVGPMDYKNETFSSMVEGIEKVKPDVIFALFSYKEGNKIFDILSKSDINGNIPIMTIPLMTDETINTENHHIENVQSIASWSFDDESDSMQGFIKKYTKDFEDAPNIMGLLGFEAGLTISSCVNSEGRIASKLTEALQNKTIETPRGTLKYNAMNESQIDTFKLRKFQFNKIKYHNTIIHTLDASYSEKLYESFEALPYSGWQNPYICT